MTCSSGRPRTSACASISSIGCARKTASSGRKHTRAVTRSDGSRHAARSARLQSLPPVHDTAVLLAVARSACASRISAGALALSWRNLVVRGFPVSNVAWAIVTEEQRTDTHHI
eukprot:scaffold90127_cov63-Phaeocystis_antarctica.AAC.4